MTTKMEKFQKRSTRLSDKINKASKRNFAWEGK